MDEQNVVYPYNKILFGHEKEWQTDGCYNMSEPYKQPWSFIPTAVFNFQSNDPPVLTVHKHSLGFIFGATFSA